MSKYKNRITVAIVIIFILFASFVFGGNVPKEPNSVPVNTPAKTLLPKQTPSPFTEASTEATQPVVTPTVQPIASEIAQTPTPTVVPEFAEPAQPVAIPEFTESTQPVAMPEITKTPAPVATQKITKDPIPQQNVTNPSPTPLPSPEPVKAEDLTCTISISCNTVLENMSLLSSDMQDIIPKDGIILAEKTAFFYEGESVFNVLAREARQNKIHLEFVNVPFYNSAYIEGIANLYEFDCGELSGWMYKVNNDFPRFGSSQYIVKSGDKIEWIYTCNSGADVGDTSGTKNGFDNTK